MTFTEMSNPILEELGDEYFNKMDKEKIKNNMVRRLEKLGYMVEVTKKEDEKMA